MQPNDHIIRDNLDSGFASLDFPSFAQVIFKILQYYGFNSQFKIHNWRSLTTSC